MNKPGNNAPRPAGAPPTRKMTAPTPAAAPRPVAARPPGAPSTRKMGVPAAAPRPATGRQAGPPKPGATAPTTTPARSTRRLTEMSTAKPWFQDKRVIIGGSVGGGLLILALLIAAFSGSSPAPAPNRTKTAPKGPTARPVDVAGLEREGLRKCEEGYKIIQGCESLMTGRALTEAEQGKLKTDLKRGEEIIRDGMTMLEEASAKTNYENKYDTVRYMKAGKAARQKIGELKGP